MLLFPPADDITTVRTGTRGRGAALVLLITKEVKTLLSDARDAIIVVEGLVGLGNMALLGFPVVLMWGGEKRFDKQTDEKPG